MKTIDGNRMIGVGLPQKEGIRLAENLINLDLDWNDLEIDMRRVDAAMLISPFFNSFLQTIYEKNLFENVRRIKWNMEFNFQQESVLEWIRIFEPY